jgi:hypothetical protein
MMEMTMTGEWHLIPEAVARGVGLLWAHQDSVHRLQDVVSCAQILGDPREGRHARIHKDLGNVPHQDS